MKKLLRRIGLLDSFTTELKISSQDLVNELNKITDKNEFYLLDIFKDNKKEYVGTISNDRFELARWRTNIFFQLDILQRPTGKLNEKVKT